MAPASVPVERVALTGEVGLVRSDGSVHRLRGRQPQLVLSYLLLERRPVERYELAELLWGERLPDHWAGAVRGVLSKVRAWLVESAIPGAELTAEDGVVRLTGATLVTDVELARQAVEDAQQAVEQGAPDVAADAAARAAALVAGPFLTHGDGDWVTRQRDRVESLLGTAARLEARARLAGGEPARAARLAADRVGRDPLDESAYHLLIESLLATGQRADAVRAHEELAAVLARELGIGPAPETTALIAKEHNRPRTTPSGPREGATRLPAIPREPHEVEVFVGRRAELGELHAAWTATVERDAAHLVVIRGDAGIGKTRLASELAGAIEASGERVLWGRCRAASGLAFEPVAEALSDAVRADPGLVGRLGPAAGHLGAIVSELPPPDPPDTPDPALERTQLFSAVTAAFAEAASAPTLWVLDDLQWASADSMALLEVLLERVPAPLLVVATYRGHTAHVDASLARLQRTVLGTTLELQGLTAADLREVVRPFRADDGSDVDALVAELERRTGGNPFFLTEITREARRAGGVLEPGRIPDSARRWIERRADSLDPPTAAVLDLAAVIGIEVDLRLLADCHAQDLDGLADACDTLLDQGLLVEAGEDRLAFPHLISREAVYERLRSPRRLQLHRRVVQAIEARPPEAGRDALLAHHLARLGPEAGERAARHALAAGEDALGRSAWALAAEHFASAADLAGPEPTLRAAALVGMGRARYHDRDLAGARAALDEAVTIARAHGSAVVLARAALQLVGRAGRGAAIGMTDAEREVLLRDALAGLDRLAAEGSDGGPAREPEEVDRLRGEIEGELALALLFADAAEERTALVGRALTRARSARPVVPRHLARALLNSRIVKIDPSQLPERLADVAEILAMPRAALDAEHVVAALAYQHEDRLLVGDREGARRSLAALASEVDRRPHPYWGWVSRTWKGLGHLIDGDLEAAEGAAFVAAEHQVGDQGESAACLGVNLISIRLWQGRSGEVIDLVADAADRFPHVPCYRAVLALCASKAGRVDLAEAAYRAFAADRFVVPTDTNRFLTLAVLADVAVDLGDIEGAALLDPLLDPYGGLQVILNCYGGGGAYWGPADHQRARLARLTGRDEDARRLFIRAGEQADAFGAPLARTAVDLDAGVRI